MASVNVRLHSAAVMFPWPTENNRSLKNNYPKIKHRFYKVTVTRNSPLFLGP